jgi:hypothetical protein
MPWLHRLACFRDDAVFVILIYQVCPPNPRQSSHTNIQRWIYRVDYSRVNEYGQVNEGMVEPVGVEGEEKKPLIEGTSEKVESKKTK